MKEIKIEDLRELDYDEGAELLENNGYVCTDTNTELSGLGGDYVTRETWERGSSRFLFEWYCDGGEVTEEVGWWETCNTAEIIETAAREFGITKAELARRLGIPRRNLFEWTSGAHEPPAYAQQLFRYMIRQELVEKKERERSADKEEED